MKPRLDYSHLKFEEDEKRQRSIIAICYVESRNDIENGVYSSGKKASKAGRDGENIYLHKNALLYYGDKFLRHVERLRFIYKPDKFNYLYQNTPTPRGTRVKEGEDIWWLPHECVRREIDLALQAKGDYSYAWYNKNPTVKDGLACVRRLLGKRYLKGHGVRQNIVHAYIWLSLAGDAGDQEALDLLHEISAEMQSAQISEARIRIERWDDEREFLAQLEELRGNGPAHFYGYECHVPNGPEPSLHHLKVGEAQTMEDAISRSTSIGYFKDFYPGSTWEGQWFLSMKGKAEAKAAEELFKAAFGNSWAKWSDTGKRDLDEYFIAGDIAIQKISKTLKLLSPHPRASQRWE